MLRASASADSSPQVFASQTTASSAEVPLPAADSDHVVPGRSAAPGAAPAVPAPPRRARMLSRCQRQSPPPPFSGRLTSALARPLELCPELRDRRDLLLTHMDAAARNAYRNAVDAFLPLFRDTSLMPQALRNRFDVFEGLLLLPAADWSRVAALLMRLTPQQLGADAAFTLSGTLQHLGAGSAAQAEALVAAALKLSQTLSGHISAYALASVLPASLPAATLDALVASLRACMGGVEPTSVGLPMVQAMLAARPEQRALLVQLRLPLVQALRDAPVKLSGTHVLQLARLASQDAWALRDAWLSAHARPDPESTHDGARIARLQASIRALLPVAAAGIPPARAQAAVLAALPDDLVPLLDLLARLQAQAAHASRDQRQLLDRARWVLLGDAPDLATAQAAARLPPLPPPPPPSPPASPPPAAARPSLASLFAEPGAASNQFLTLADYDYADEDDLDQDMDIDIETGFGRVHGANDAAEVENPDHLNGPLATGSAAYALGALAGAEADAPLLQVPIKALCMLVWQHMQGLQQDAEGRPVGPATRQRLQEDLVVTLGRCVNDFGQRLCADGIADRLMALLAGYHPSVVLEPPTPARLATTLLQGFQRQLDVHLEAKGGAPEALLGPFLSACVGAAQAQYATSPEAMVCFGNHVRAYLAHDLDGLQVPFASPPPRPDR